MGFVKNVLDNGGAITPLIIPSSLSNGTGTFNPTIFNDDGNLLINIRHCQVTIYHSELNKFEHEWGPLSYMNPENDITLTTTNYFCTVNKDFYVDSVNKVDTSAHDVKPIWEFIGLEDCRLVRWDDKLYVCGVRRDTTTNGVGRMELSQLSLENGVKEISRDRMPAPPPDASYCEKNWMPILDKPYHFVKWTNPLEVVKYDPEAHTTTTVKMGTWKQRNYDIRGGSQVIKLDDHYVALCHESRLYNSEQGRKNATYRHLFVVWDQDFNLVRQTEPFDFMNTKIEFCAGMCIYEDQLLITFGVQDNAAYLLRLPLDYARKVIYNDTTNSAV